MTGIRRRNIVAHNGCCWCFESCLYVYRRDIRVGRCPKWRFVSLSYFLLTWLTICMLELGLLCSDSHTPLRGISVPGGDLGEFLALVSAIDRTVSIKVSDSYRQWFEFLKLVLLTRKLCCGRYIWIRNLTTAQGLSTYSVMVQSCDYWWNFSFLVTLGPSIGLWIDGWWTTFAELQGGVQVTWGSLVVFSSTTQCRLFPP